MIDPKYLPQLKPILEGHLKRPATQNELMNALVDQQLIAELLIKLHEQNATSIIAIEQKVGPVII